MSVAADLVLNGTVKDGLNVNAIDLEILQDC